jgi:hypothetical protein
MIHDHIYAGAFGLVRGIWQSILFGLGPPASAETGAKKASKKRLKKRRKSV